MLKKTHYMIFKNSKRKKLNSIDIRINNIQIEKVNETKFLGIIIDNQLKWKPHLNYVCSKVSKSIGIIGRLRFVLPKYTLRTLYYSLIYPYLNYGSIIWGNTFLSNLNRLKKLQKKAIRIISLSTFRSHTNPLFKAESLLKLEDIISLSTVSFMYLFNNNELPRTFDNVFQLNNEIHTYNTRRSQNYHIASKKTRLGQFSISYVGPIIWNKYKHLSQNCRNVHKFKQVIKKELMSVY